MHTYAQAGTYTVQLTATNIYGSNSAFTTITVTDCSIGIATVLAQAIKLYPNPASLQLHLDYPAECKGGIVEISQLNGQVVHSQTLPNDRQTLSLPVELLPRGVYIATIRKGDVSLSRSVVLH